MKNFFFLTLFVLSKCFLFSEVSQYQDSLLEKKLTQREIQLIEHVIKSIRNAEHHLSKLNNQILLLEGMSSPKVRHFLNNLCSLPNTHYLEIGCWKGSTFISSLFNNQENISSAIAIDNWEEFGGPKQQFLNNCSDFLSKNTYTFYEVDCFKINPLTLCKEPVNIYFYDGNHSRKSQELAFTYYNDIFDDVFIAVVDDWNWPMNDVRIGTKTAFQKLGYTVLFEKAMPARWNIDTENWWNGLYIAVIRK